MKYTSRADLLIAAGESIKMQEKYGIEPWCKYRGQRVFIKFVSLADQLHDCDAEDKYEFPIAVVEGKPVFVGDELYDSRGNKFTAGEILHSEGKNYLCDSGYSKRGFGKSHQIEYCSWNPPKPKTVMVELLREDAEEFAKHAPYPNALITVVNACRKALEKA